MMRVLQSGFMTANKAFMARNAMGVESSSFALRHFAAKKKKRKQRNPVSPPNPPRAFDNFKDVLTTSAGKTRSERIKELRQIAKEKILDFEDECRIKSKGEKIPEPPADAAHHLLQFLDNDVPEDLLPSKDAIQDFILNTFFVKYPKGARMRKLQRDIAFRMDTADAAISKQKIQYEKIMPIIGELERANKLKVRVGKQGRFVIYQPSATQLAVEELNQKIDQVVKGNLAATGDSDEKASSKSEDEDEPLELSAKESRRRRFGKDDDEIDWVEEFRVNNPED